MKKYQIIINFKKGWEFDEMMCIHRNYINFLINSDVVDVYALVMETNQILIILNARDKSEANTYIMKSPLYRYFLPYSVDEISVYDGQALRFPALQLN